MRRVILYSADETNLKYPIVNLYYRPQRSWGKVIFSEACVKNSVHSVGGGYPSMPCRSPGPHLGEELEGSGLEGPQAHTQGGIPACTEADPSPPPLTVTAAGGTHPTGMHCCLVMNLILMIFYVYVLCISGYIRCLFSFRLVRKSIMYL